MLDQASESEELTARISAEWNLDGEEDVAATAEDKAATAGDAEPVEAFSVPSCVDM